VKAECDDALGRALVAKTAAEAKRDALAAKLAALAAKRDGALAPTDRSKLAAAAQRRRTAKARSNAQSTRALKARVRLNHYRTLVDRWKQRGSVNATPNPLFVAVLDVYARRKENEGEWISLASPWLRARHAPRPPPPPRAAPRAVNDLDSSEDERPGGPGRPAARTVAAAAARSAANARAAAKRARASDDLDSSDSSDEDGSSSDEDVVMVGERSWGQRDAEARRNAVDLTSAPVSGSCVEAAFRKVGL